MTTLKSDPTCRRCRRFGAVTGVALASILLLSGCRAASNEAGETSEPEVLARIGEVEISRTEVEGAVAPQLRELDQQRYDLLEQGLEAAVNEKLVEIAAGEQGDSTEDFLEAEVQSKLREVTEADIDLFYEQRKDQIRQPKEAVVAQIRQFLEQAQRQELMGALLSDLRERYQPETLLEPTRVVVETAGAPSQGPATAPVTIVEFSDFQCPFCSRVIPTLERVVEKYPDSVRLVFRQFPLLSIHPQAQKAAEASLCAHDQGKFWEMHDSMFADQSALSLPELKSKAASLGLDAGVFEECLDSGKRADTVTEDLEAGMAAGVSGTPALFINGRFLSGAQPYERVAQIIDDELARVGG